MTTGKQTKRGEKSRGEKLGDAAQLPDNPAPHLTDWLFDAGPLAPDGSALGWQDLTAWQVNVGIELEPWEGRLIRRLSGVYGNMRHRAEKPDCAAPFTLGGTEVAKDRVADQFKAMVSAFKGRQKG